MDKYGPPNWAGKHIKVAEWHVPTAQATPGDFMITSMYELWLDLLLWDSCIAREEV